MARFSSRSESRLDTAVEALQVLFRWIVVRYDCTILCGHRGKVDQDRAVREGRSRVRYPNGKHNAIPSNAVDASPWPIPERWGDIPIPGKLTREQRTAIGRRVKTLAQFYHFAGYTQGVAERSGTPVRWGGDWDGDRIFTDQSFDDLVHFEVKPEPKTTEV